MRIISNLVLLVCLLSASAFADSLNFKEVKTLPLKQAFSTIKDWHVTALQPEGAISLDEDARTGDVSAKLCFWFVGSNRQEECTFINSALFNGGMTYHFQTVRDLVVIPTPHLIAFITEFYGNGSEALNQLSFWRYDTLTDSFLQAGLVTFTEQGEYKLIDGMLIIADARWGDGETHFEPHYFDITVYRYVLDSGYEKIFSYLTAKKYPGLNDVNNIDVISHEIPKIMKRLSFQQ